MSETPRPDFSRLRILVIEDDFDSREFLGTVLRSCGAHVDEADNIEAAKEFVRNARFDLVVTDLAMPGEDGAMFLKWLRQQPRDKGGTAAVVAVTAYYEMYPPSQLSGWAAYFQKPVELDQFIDTIASIFHLPRRSNASV